MDSAEFAKAVEDLVAKVRPIDAAFADMLENEGRRPEDPEAPNRVQALVGDWSADYGKREPYWTYSGFSIAASRAMEDGVDALAAETEAAFVAYAEGIASLDKTSAEHQAALERIRDTKRTDAFAALVAKVEALGAKAGIRVRHAGLTRALERCVPNPGFVTEYRQTAHENPAELATTGALVGTAMMPIVGTVIGGVAGWLGGHAIHGKTAEPNLDKQKAQIVYTAGQLRAEIEKAGGDASDLIAAQMPWTGSPVGADEDWRMLVLHNAVERFLSEEGG